MYKRQEIEWVEKDCQYNIEQRKKYRAVWFLFRDLIRASWKACYRNGVIYMSLPTLNGTDMHDTTSPEAVSYTHLDVYTRQPIDIRNGRIAAR